MSSLSNLLIHDKTLLQARAFLRHPTHALLISGPAGSGKAHLAYSLAAELLNIEVDELTRYPYFAILQRPEGKQDIPIDSVRTLNSSLKLKVPASGEVKRVTLIESAQDLNEESSNALLKIIEEPSPGNIFILTTDNPKSLLPTITSRAQQLQVFPLSLDQTQLYLDGKYSISKIENAWMLSQGGAGLMLALLNNQDDHPLKQSIDSAKKYLSQDKYQRTITSDALSKDKQQLKVFLDALTKLLAALYHSSVDRGNVRQQKRLLSSRKLVNKLSGMLDNNASPKLIALELSLNLL